MIGCQYTNEGEIIVPSLSHWGIVKRSRSSILSSKLMLAIRVVERRRYQ